MERLISSITASILIMCIATGCGKISEKINSKIKSLRQSVEEMAKKEPVDPVSSFYTYEGIRDYWRFPMVYPYQVEMVDVPSIGDISLFTNVDAPCRFKNDILVEHITLLCFNKKCAVFLTKSDDKGTPDKWGHLSFKTGKITYFSTIRELESFLGSQDDTLEFKDIRFLPIEAHFNAFSSCNQNSSDKNNMKCP